MSRPCSSPFPITARTPAEKSAGRYRPMRSVVVGPAEPMICPGLAGDGPTAYMICPSSETGSGSPRSIACASRAALASRSVSTRPVSSTESPADSFAASVAGKPERQSSGIESVNRLSSIVNSEFDRHAASRMTAEIHRDWQAGDVCRQHLDVDGKRRHEAAESLWSDAERVDAIEEVRFEFGEIGARVADRQIAQRRFLGEQRRRLERATDAHADDDRGAGVGAGPLNRFNDHVDDARHAVGWDEHAHGAHVLRAEALRRNGKPDATARRDLGMHDTHVVRTLLRIDRLPRHLQPSRRVASHRSPQIAALRALANPGVNRLVKRAAYPVHVLSDLEEHDGHAAVLIDGHTLSGGDLVVAHQLLERPASKRRLLARDRHAKRVENVGGNVVVGLDDQPSDRVAEQGDVDIASHRLGSGIRAAAPGGTWSRL